MMYIAYVSYMMKIYDILIYDEYTYVYVAYLYIQFMNEFCLDKVIETSTKTSSQMYWDASCPQTSRGKRNLQ